MDIADIFAEVQEAETAWDAVTQQIRDAECEAESVKARIDERLNRKTKRLRKQRDRLPGVGTRAVVERIAALLAPMFPGHALTVSGPFGMGHTMHIFADDVQGRSVAVLTFRRGGEESPVVQVDTETDTGGYPRGSIGYLNGFHHPSRVIDSIAALAAEMTRQIALDAAHSAERSEA